MHYVYMRLSLVLSLKKERFMHAEIWYVVSDIQEGFAANKIHPSIKYMKSLFLPWYQKKLNNPNLICQENILNEYLCCCRFVPLFHIFVEYSKLLRFRLDFSFSYGSSYLE